MRRPALAIVTAVLAGVVTLTVAPADAVGDEPRDTVDETADTLDGESTAARCQVWSEVWPGPAGNCPLDPEAEYRCALWGETTSAQSGADGLRYTLAGELECREDGRALRILHGTFETGEGLVTRTCANPWCEKRGVPYDAYALVDHRPRCTYTFTGSGGPQEGGRSVYERSSAPPDSDDRLTLRVDLPHQTGTFRADDFAVANGDGVGARGGLPPATANPWVLDDGVPENGWSEGVVDLRVTMHEHAAGPATGDPLANCLPTDELSGFAVEGSLEFVVGEESLFRPPS